MKKLFLLIIISIFSIPLSFGQHQDIDSSEDEKKVKFAVVSWADSIFYSHSEYKFNHFKAFYTEEYFIAVMRARMYKERADDLEKDKNAGRYKKSDAEYEKEHDQMIDSYTKIQKEVDNFAFRVSYFQIHFWSNIKTNDGITVYYEHIVKLDNHYQVTGAEVHSAIGKKSDKTQILYKKDIKGSQKKKVDKSDIKKEVSTKTDKKNGTVTLIIKTDEGSSKTDDIEVEKSSKKKKKDKKKKGKRKKK